jgi:sister-chromatid-cohesion protein PDS5
MVRSSTALAAGTASMPTWTRIVQKGQPTDTLIKKLKAARQELAQADQDQIPLKTLDHVRTQIMHDDLLFHKNKDVRIYLACSLAELLRLYAPNCPFNDEQLTTMFAFFLAVIGSSTAGLKKGSGQQYTECVTLLSNLVSTRAFALLCERGLGDKPIEAYFAKFLEIVTPSTPKNVEMLMVEALTLLLQYSNSVPAKVVDLLLDHAHSKVKRLNPAAHQLAALVCTSAADELQTHIAQHFASSLAKAAQLVDEQERESGLHALHLQVSCLHSCAPGILVNVIPQLEEELRAEDAKLRQLATRTLGGLFCEQARKSSQDLTGLPMYKSAFEAWLRRAWDRVSSVRVTWIESTLGMLSSNGPSGLRVGSILEQKATDSDERVRLAVIKAIADLGITSLRGDVPMALLHSAGERILDKKHAVRLAALHAVGRAYSLAYATFSDDDQAAFAPFSWIPGAICGALFADNDKGLRSAAAVTIGEHILPLPTATDDEGILAWSTRLLLVLDQLNDEQLSAFATLSGIQGRRICLSRFVETCRRFNGGTVDEAQEEEIKRTLLREMAILAANFHDQVKAGHDLHAFAQKNDDRAYKLLMAIVDPCLGLRDVAKAYGELQRRWGAEKYGSTMLALTTMASCFLVNTSAIPMLFDAVSSEVEERRKKASLLLGLTASHRPELLKAHVDLLKSSVTSDVPSSEAQQAMALRLLAGLKSKAHLQGGSELEDAHLRGVEKLMQNAKHEDVLKYGAKLLSLIASDITTASYATAFHIAEGLCERFKEEMSSQVFEKVNANLIALRQIAKHAREVIAQHGDSITIQLLEEILLEPLSDPTIAVVEDDNEEVETSKDWIEDTNMGSTLKVRLSALRFLVARASAYANHDDVERYTVPTLRALLTCLTTGELGAGLCGEHDGAKARLRCEAACLLLKLARKSSCDRLIGVTDLQLLSQVFQDPVWQVRHILLRKWLKYFLVRSSHLPPRYYILGFMVAFDPEEESRSMVRNACAKLLSAMKPELRLRYFDIGLARLIHLLNHHPDFESSVPKEGDVPLEILEEIAPYLEFYLSSCANRENLACLSHIAARCKGMRDMADEASAGTAQDDGTASKGIHTLSDLCICLLKRRAEGLGVVVESWQGHVALPRDLFVPYVSREEQNKVLKRSYLTDEAMELFTQPHRSVKASGNGVVPPKRSLAHLLEHSSKSPAASKKAKGVDRKKPQKPSSRKTKQRGRRSEVESDDDASMSEDAETDEEGQPDGGSDQMAVSEDETVEASTDEDEDTAGRGARVRRRLRQEKRARNENRQRRREQRRE